MFAEFLTFLDTHSGGFVVLFFILFAGLVLLQWLAWIFCFGRFNPRIAGPKVAASNLRFVFADLLVKIINDFRHLLALLMVLIFAAALGYVIFRAGQNLEEISKALQVVVATLGGLIGSIIGYYFGESAAKKTGAEPTERERPAEEPAQSGDRSADEPIIPVPPPQAPAGPNP